LAFCRTIPSAAATEHLNISAVILGKEPVYNLNQLLAIVGTVFGLLTLLGVVNDPTTAGVSDSDKALGYEQPKQ
jgi:phi LC3 family holin